MHCTKATKLQFLRCDPKAPPLADGERCRPYSGDWESTMLGKVQTEKCGLTWFGWFFSMFFQYDSMTFNDIQWHSMTFNDIQWHSMILAPVSGAWYLTSTWGARRTCWAEHWTEVLHFRTDQKAVARVSCRPQISAVESFCTVIVLPSLFHHILKCSRRSCTLPHGPWSWSLDTWTRSAKRALSRP